MRVFVTKKKHYCSLYNSRVGKNLAIAGKKKHYRAAVVDFTLHYIHVINTLSLEIPWNVVQTFFLILISSLRNYSLTFKTFFSKPQFYHSWTTSYIKYNYAYGPHVVSGFTDLSYNYFWNYTKCEYYFDIKADTVLDNTVVLNFVRNHHNF